MPDGSVDFEEISFRNLLLSNLFKTITELPHAIADTSRVKPIIFGSVWSSRTIMPHGSFTDVSIGVPMFNEVLEIDIVAHSYKDDTQEFVKHSLIEELKKNLFVFCVVEFPFSEVKKYVFVEKYVE